MKEQDVLKTIGKVITEQVKRDAVHIAIAPVVAGMFLRAGARVRLAPATLNVIIEAFPEDAIGIVDPFLSHGVDMDNLCWLFLFPGSVTSLRHEWTHPAFAAAEVKKYMEQKNGTDTR